MVDNKITKWKQDFLDKFSTSQQLSKLRCGYDERKYISEKEIVLQNWMNGRFTKEFASPRLDRQKRSGMKCEVTIAEPRRALELQPGEIDRNHLLFLGLRFLERQNALGDGGEEVSVQISTECSEHNDVNDKGIFNQYGPLHFSKASAIQSLEIRGQLIVKVIIIFINGGNLHNYLH
ncbi:hypothetical protein ACLOJK_003303 [Asimina triloba]